MKRLKSKKNAKFQSVVRTLILPDLHNNWEKAEKIIKHESADEIVFLGDYFDNFYDNSIIAASTAQWLSSSLKQNNRRHIFGNHDINYAFHNKSYKCSGYDISKDYAISEIINESDWKKLSLFTWVGSWLCSHAGVHTYFYKEYGKNKSFNTWLTEICDEALTNAFENKPASPILKAGRSRFGTEKYGGIVWCDVREFQPVYGINQIFGHTPCQKPVWSEYKHSRNLCLDVGNCDYYVIHDSKNDADIKIRWINNI